MGNFEDYFRYWTGMFILLSTKHAQLRSSELTTVVLSGNLDTGWSVPWATPPPPPPSASLPALFAW